MLCPQGRQLSGQRLRRLHDGQTLPGIDTTGHAAGNDRFHRGSSIPIDRSGKPHPQQQANIWAVGPHPQRDGQLVNHPHRIDRLLVAKPRARGCLEHDLLAGRSSVGRRCGASVGNLANIHVRLGPAKADDGPLKRLLKNC